MEAVGAEFLPPMSQVQVKLLGLRNYVHAGRSEEALQHLGELAGKLQPPMDALVSIGRIAVHEAMEDPEALAVAVQDARAMLERTGLKLVEQDVVYGQGRLHEIRGEWPAAVAAYQQELALAPTDTNIPMQLGRVYRAMGDLAAAERALQATLTARPSHARANYELALVHEARGRRADAVRHLERALATWANADAAFGYARQAREKLAEL